MFVCATIAMIVATAPSQAVFDGAQTGDLPKVRVDRPLPAQSADGTLVEEDAPRWGPKRAVCSMPDWSHVWEAPGSIRVLISGVARDGRTPALLAINHQVLRLSFFTGDLDEPDFEWNLKRVDDSGEKMDLLAHHPLRREHEAFAVRSGCMLPGCVLLHCERSARIGNTWVPEGISVFALQHRGDEWVLEHVSDGPRVGGGTACLGWPRGWLSSMQNYYPVPSDGPMAEAFIPYVDYQNHRSQAPARGGQCFLLKAVRDDVTDRPWRFEGPLLLHEFLGAERQHAHAAAWTPRGVLLAIGDGAQADVKLFACDDWSDWLNPDQWTMHSGMHGEPSEDGVSSLNVNQFWAACPGAGPDEVLIGGDNVSTAVMSVTIPDDLSEGLHFIRRWGRQYGAPSDDGQRQTTCSCLVAHRPESDGPVLARVNREGGMYDESHARILLSTDRRHFATLARMTDGASEESPIAIMGSHVLQGRYGAPEQKGIWSIPLPEDVQISQGLLTSPGGIDLLRGQTLEMTPGTGTTVEALSRTTGESDLIAQAPGVGSVWHVQREVQMGETIATLDLPLVDGMCADHTLLARTWICNLGPGQLSIRQRLDAGDEVENRRAKVATSRSWVPLPMMTRVGDFALGVCPNLDLVATSVGQDSGSVNFLITIDGMFVDGMGSWRPMDAMAPSALPAEIVTLPLKDVGAQWTLSMDFVLPEDGIDFGLGSRFGTWTAATVMCKNGDELKVQIDPVSQEAHLMVIRDGELAGHVSHDGVRIERLDTLGVRISGDAGRVGFEVRSGGTAVLRTEAMPGLAMLELSQPVSVHIGDRFGVSTPLECHRVTLDDQLSPMDFDIDDSQGEVSVTCPADLDEDGQVAVEDLLLLMGSWGPCGEELCSADLDQNGIVDTADLLVMLGGWGPCPVAG